MKTNTIISDLQTAVNLIDTVKMENIEYVNGYFNLPELNDALQRIALSTEFISYQLNLIETYIVVFIWMYQFDDSKNTTRYSVLSSSFKNSVDAITLELLRSLLKKGVIEYLDNQRNLLKTRFLNVLLQPYTLCTEILVKIYHYDFEEKNKDIFSRTLTCDDDVYQCIVDYFESVTNPFSNSDDNHVQEVVKHDHRISYVNYYLYRKGIKSLVDQLCGLNDSYKFKALINKYNLDVVEIEIILLVFFITVINDDYLFVKDILLLILENNQDLINKKPYLTNNSRLEILNILYYKPNETELNNEKVVLSKSIRDFLINPKLENQNAKMDLKDMNSSFVLTENNASMKNLILSVKNKDMLMSIIKNMNNFDLLKDWGLDQTNSLSKIIFLFGNSGTGKTYTAGVIANELNKELISIDATELRNKYYGESERLIRNLFNDMNEVVSSSSNPPVFVINEADHLLHKRVDSNDSVEMAENSIQSIMLECMESFKGILILTSNLKMNIDSAYYRRFRYKLSFDNPEFEERLKLWQLFISPKIPGYQNINFEFLAQKYFFTGAQIKLIVENACIEAIGRENEYKQLTQSDLFKYCELEASFVNETNKANGF